MDRLVRSFYSYRKASIGFKFEAFIDGTIPKTMPIAMENSTAMITAGVLIDTGIRATAEII